MKKIIVFDVGGTLMEYINMPFVWLDFYPEALDYAISKLGINPTKEQSEAALETLRKFNPKVNYREKDYAPEYIFGKATESWDFEFSLRDLIYAFFESMNLTPYIYPETIPVLEELKQRGYTICTLTDVATGMPDELHKSYFKELLPYFDFYVSSITCGMRKPNTTGLKLIEKKYGVLMSEFVMIGDEEKDIKTAKNAGCKSVLIERKKRTRDFGQDFTARDLHEVLEYIDDKAVL